MGELLRITLASDNWVKRALDMRDKNISFRRIAEILGKHENTVKTEVYKVMRPKSGLVRQRADRRTVAPHRVDVDRNCNPTYDPKRDGEFYPRDLTGLLMGDPPAGRSALDMRGLS